MAGWVVAEEGGTRVHDVDENQLPAAPDPEDDTTPSEEARPDTEEKHKVPLGERVDIANDPPAAPQPDGDRAPDDNPPTPDTSDPVENADGSEAHRDELRAIEIQIDALRKSFDSRAAAYEDTIRSLQTTIEELRGQQLTGMMKPTFQQFADLKAELDAAAQRARDSSDEHHAEEYEFFSGSVDGIMDHFDLESVRATIGDPFDRRAHAAVLRKPTDDPHRDRTIARVARQGFRVIGEPRVLIPARVVIWSYTPPENDSVTAASGEADTSG